MKPKNFEDYCDGCNNLHYEPETGLIYCLLNKEPRPHPDEPEFPYCESKDEGDDFAEVDGL